MMQNLEGQKFAGFEIISKIAAGAMGTVYRALQPSLNRMVAIKILPPALAQNPTFIERFQREATAAAKLSHSNIVQIHAAGECDGTHYIAMEFVEGETVWDRLQREGRLPPDEALAVCVHVAQALDHAWNRARIIHRDIKPNNILLSKDGEVKLADLGLAKSVTEDSGGLTQDGMAVGTPYYISPEQARGDKEIDFRADIYSLGCTLYHLLTGKPPYEAQDTLGLVYKHVNDPPPAILKVWPTCPMPLVMLLGKMLKKRPAERHQCYEELIEEMRQVHRHIVHGPAVAAARSVATAAAPPARNRMPLVIGGVAAVVVVAGVLLWAPWRAGEGASGKREAEKGLESRLQAESVRPQPAKAGTPNAEAPSKPPAKTEVAAVSTPSPTAGGTPALPGGTLSPPPVAERASVQMEAADPTLARSATSADPFVAQIAALPAEQQVQHVMAELKRLNPDFDGRETHTLRDDAVTQLAISAVGVKDVSPLRALRQLDEVRCSGTQEEPSPLSDLSPLRGLRLRHLACDFTAVSDLTPLAGMPLAFLDLSGTRVSDLTPLAGLPLTELRCPPAAARNKEIAQLLLKLPTLQRVNGQSPAAFLASLARAPVAERASVRMEADDPFIKAVATLPAEQQVARVVARLKELNPQFDGKETHKIEGGAVTELSFSTVGVADISPLKALKWLKKLIIVPLALNQKGALSDLAPLQGLPLTWLWCHHNPITDLTPLRGMPLTTLSFSGTQVTELSPLSGMKLTILSFSDTPVSDLAPLADMPLTVLWCNNTKVTDLSPLQAMPLQELKCDFVPARDAALLRGIKTLARINDTPAQAFWLRVGNITPSQITVSSTSRPPTDELAWARSINLLPMIDPEQDTIKGKWRIENGKLVCAPESFARIQIPFEPPEEYDYRIVFCRHDGLETIAQFISHGGRSAMLNMACYHSTIIGFDIVGGKAANNNPTTYHLKTPLKNGQIYSSVLQVRKRGVKVYLDGKHISEWKTDYTDGSVQERWQLPDGRLLGVGAYSASTTFHKIELIEITGKGKRLREQPAVTAVVPPATIVPAAKTVPTLSTGPEKTMMTSTGMEMVWIPPGEFMMGSTAKEREWAVGPEGKHDPKFLFESGEPKRVAIKNGFWMGRTEVTNGQWKSFVDATGYVTDAEKRGTANAPDPKTGQWRDTKGASWRNPNFGFPRKEDHAVCCISWNDATAFCGWLTETEKKAGKLPAGMVYRLPGEAEWEYACRGGKEGMKFWWGDTMDKGKGRLNATTGSWASQHKYVAPVDSFGSRGRNGFGLADMLGNVWEWCLDGFDPQTAHEEPYKERTSQRVLRGGSFHYCQPGFIRCAVRYRNRPFDGFANFGFRVCCGVPGGSAQPSAASATVPTVTKSPPLTAAATTGGADAALASELAWLRAINLMPLIDLEKDTVSGEWKTTNGALVSGEKSSSGMWSLIQIPYQPPDEYDFRICFVRLSGRLDIAQILSKRGRSFAWDMGINYNKRFGFTEVNGEHAHTDRNPTSMEREGLKNGQSYTSLVSVRNDGVKAYLDGELISQWRTDFSDMSTYKGCDLRDSSLLGLGTCASSASFSKIELLEIGGKGKRLRSGAVVTAPVPTVPQPRPATPAAGPPVGLIAANRQVTIKMTVDGEDRVKIRGRLLWVEHVSAGKPVSISINGEPWLPGWKGQKTEMFGRLGAALASFENAKVSIQQRAGRNPVVLEEPPTAQNGQTISLLFQDRGGGTDTYEVTVVW